MKESWAPAIYRLDRQIWKSNAKLLSELSRIEQNFERKKINSKKLLKFAKLKRKRASPLQVFLFMCY